MELQQDSRAKTRAWKDRSQLNSAFLSTYAREQILLTVPPDSPTRGVIYVAVGDKYIEQARVSAFSAKSAMPQVSITLFCGQQLEDPAPFDGVIQIQSSGDPYEDKILCIRRSPYRKTLFLDVDTFVCSELSELWELLDRYDLAAAHAPNRIAHDDTVHPALTTLPASFPEFNTGVVLYRNSSATEELFHAWLEYYREVKGAKLPSKDQPSFRLAMFRSTELRHCTLIPEYNCRISMAGFINRPVKILHACRSEAEFRAIRKTIEAELGGRWSAHLVHIEGKLYAQSGRVIEIG